MWAAAAALVVARWRRRLDARDGRAVQSTLRRRRNWICAVRDCAKGITDHGTPQRHLPGGRVFLALLLPAGSGPDAEANGGRSMVVATTAVWVPGRPHDPARMVSLSGMTGQRGNDSISRLSIVFSERAREGDY